MKDLKKKLDKVVVAESSVWMEDAVQFEKNKDWLDYSAEIALCVLDALHEKRMTQKALAASMGVSPQQVSKILKGTENLTLETISKLERALKIKIVSLHSYGKTFDAAVAGSSVAMGYDRTPHKISSAPTVYSLESYSFYCSGSKYNEAS